MALFKEKSESPLFTGRLHSETPASTNGSTTLKPSPNNSSSNKQHDDNINIKNYYSLKPNTIPPYVIDRLSHYDINKYEQDPFVSTFKDSNGNVIWSDFITALKAPTGTVSQHENHIPTSESYGNVLKPDSGNIKSSDETQNLESIDEERNEIDKVDDIFKDYDLNSKWKGGIRLKGLFGSPSIISNDIDDESENESYSSSNSSNLNDMNLDLEKGQGRSRKEKLYRLNRERDIKKRAKLWLDENKKAWKPKLFQSMMTNAYLPLFFRMFSLCLTAVALGLSAKLVHVTRQNHVRQQASPLMALIVQACSVIYLIYITYDEFFSQPLGLRNPRAKIRLLMFDLLFIIFSAANLSICFQSIYDNRWVCSENLSSDAILYDPGMCVEVKALTAFLLLVLVVGCINISISIFRVVHNVSNRDKN